MGSRKSFVSEWNTDKNVTFELNISRHNTGSRNDCRDYSGLQSLPVLWCKDPRQSRSVAFGSRRLAIYLLNETCQRQCTQINELGANYIGGCITGSPIWLAKRLKVFSCQVIGETWCYYYTMFKYPLILNVVALPIIVNRTNTMKKGNQYIIVAYGQ